MYSNYSEWPHHWPPQLFFLAHPVQFPSNHKTLRETSQVRVLDRLPQPPGPEEEVWGDPDRSYNLGLGGDTEGKKSSGKFGRNPMVYP